MISFSTALLHESLGSHDATINGEGRGVAEGWGMTHVPVSPKMLRWHGELKNNLRRRQEHYLPRWRYELRDARQRALLARDQDLVRIGNIPETALRRFRVEYGDRSIIRDDIFGYVYGLLHGRTPQDWLIFYCYKKLDRRSGLVDDANEWFAHPRDLVTTFRWIVYLSVETERIVNAFPDPSANSERDERRQR